MDWTQLCNDYSAKYKHCYARITLEGHRTAEVFFLDEVEPTTKAPLLHFHNNKIGEIILKWDDSCSDIDWSFPPIGLISHNNQVFMIRKKYDRQWKGGPNASTLAIQHLYSRIHTCYSGNYLDFDNLHIAFQVRPLVSISEGLKQLKSKAAVALSSEFAIGLPITNDEDVLLFYYSNPIGTINVVSKYILLEEKQFKQEFEDFTRQIPGVEKYELRS